jgi:hypothetical protein
MPSVIVASVSAVLRPAVLLAVVVALVAGCGGDDHPQLVVGAVEDAVREPGRGAEVMKQLHDAASAPTGSRSIWSPGQTEPTPDELATLQRVADEADDRGVRLFLSVYPAGSATTPLTPEARSEFARYARSIVQRVPQNQGRDRRQRAEPEPLLDAAVRRGRGPTRPRLRTSRCSPRRTTR